MEYAGYIVVKDTSGARLKIGRFRGRRFLRQVTHFVLEAGPKVVRLDDNTFLLPRSGERFQRVK